MERIQRILEEEMRPAVAMDGGDVVFAGFRDGVVELYLQGSCSGLPELDGDASLRHRAAPAGGRSRRCSEVVSV